MACDMSLRDVQTIHVSNMLERDSVTLLVSATKMVKTDLFTSSHVHFRRIEPNEFLSRIGMFLKSHPRAVQIGSSRLANSVERKIKKMITLNRK